MRTVIKLVLVGIVSLALSGCLDSMVRSAAQINCEDNLGGTWNSATEVCEGVGAIYYTAV